MSARTTRRLATLITLAALLDGCALAGLPTSIPSKPGAVTPGQTGTVTPGGATSLGGANVPATPARNVPLEPLNGITFTPITAANSKFLAANGSSIVSSGGGNLASNSGAGASAGSVETAPTAAAGMAPAPMADAAMGSAGATTTSMVSAPNAIAHSTPMIPVPPPSTTGSAPSGVGGAVSGNVDAYYDYNSYFGGGYAGGFGGESQMALVSLQQAETAGSTGGFADIVAKIAAPVVKSWANDARLINSNALLDNQGALVNSQGGGSGPTMKMDVAVYNGGFDGQGDGWTLTYVSPSRMEVMTFAVTAAKTTILRMHWEPLNLSPELVLTDSGAAIKKMIDAIQDKQFASDEEKSGKDYFLGYPYVQQSNGDFPEGGMTTEVVYQVSQDARWNIDLEEVMGKLVWNLSFYGDAPMPVMMGGTVAMPMVSTNNAVGVISNNGGELISNNNAGTVTASAVAVSDVATPPIMARPINGGPVPPPLPGCVNVPQQDNGWFNNSARGMVDAQTGAVIRFTRPTRTHYPQEVTPSCNQIGMPDGGPVTVKGVLTPVNGTTTTTSPPSTTAVGI